MALELFGLLHDQCGQAAAHLELAEIEVDDDGDPGPQLDLASRAVLDPSREMEASIDNARARAALRDGKFAEAERLLKQAVQHVEHHNGAAYHRARYLAQLGLVARLRGAETAKPDLLRAKGLAESGGFRRVEASCLLDLGQISLKRKNKHLELARIQLATAAARFAEVEDILGEAHAYSALGATWRLQGDLDQAIDCLTRALAVYVARGHLAGEALAHRRRAQCYIDLLHRAGSNGRPPSPDEYVRASDEVDVAIAQFEDLGSVDGRAVALATKGRLLYLTEGAAAALEPAWRAVQLLGEVRGQFRQGLERLHFGRLHSWVFGFAMLCAVESDEVDTALRIAAIVRAETLGGAARQALSREPGPLGERLAELCDHEQGLRRSGSDAVPIGFPLEEVRGRRDDLFAALNRELVQALRPPLERKRPGPGCYRLYVQLFERNRGPEAFGEEDALYVLCEGPAVDDKAMCSVKLSSGDRHDIEAIARADMDALWDARGLRWERMGRLVLPRDLGQLRDDLLQGRVEILEIEPARDLVTFPFGALLVDGHPLDELTRVLLSPSDMPSCSWLWRGQEGQPPDPSPLPERARRIADPRVSSPATTTVDDTFQEIVAELTDVGSFSERELMEIATGEHTLKQLFIGDEAVASHFRMVCERYVQKGESLLQAVQFAKSGHRRGCGGACPPAHVGGFVVAGQLENEPTMRAAS